MATLHLVSRSPSESLALAQCLARAGAGEGILLLDGGVYAAAAGSSGAALLAPFLTCLEVYALAPDLAARGVTDILAGAQAVDYAGFVALSLRYARVLSWF